MDILLYTACFCFNRRSPRNFLVETNSNNQQRNAENIVVPKNVQIKKASFKYSSRVAGIQSGSSQQQANTLFEFTAKGIKTLKKAEDKVLSNITNASANSSSRFVIKSKGGLNKPLSYKPHKGKLPEWNPKKTLAERKAMAAKVSAKTKNGDIIKGVRLNKRAELLMQKRGLNTFERRAHKQ